MNPILKLEEVPQMLVEIYNAETKMKTDKGIYVNEYTNIKAVITKYLDKYQKGNYTYYQDTTGNVYVKPINSSNSNIVLSAHMDKVHTNGKIAILYYDKATGKIYGMNKDKKQTSLGADDKNGIFAILEIYRRVPADKLPSVIFTVDEESGCVGSSAIDKDFFTDKKFCIVIDRRNHYDLIYKGSSTYYGITTPLIFHKLNPEFKFEIGSCSDANQFSKYVDSMNVSCGYYNPHGSTEYTIVNELLDTVDAVEKFVLNANSIADVDTKEYLELLNKSTYTYSSYSYSSYWDRDKDVDDDYDYGDYSKSYYKKSNKKKNKKRNFWAEYYGLDEDGYDPEDTTTSSTGLDTCPLCGHMDCYSKIDNECLFCGRLDNLANTKGDDKNKDAKMSNMQQTAGGSGDNLQQKK